ncbi:uncharacterized protein ATC70_004162 [Mucor velutinosus]|uniref:Uncharacterized protein n=1 Tax=Mucor velutinosus TaxID=708070 RepID=A0AAN7I4P8_9FUNG|nr:hypothetical protein ATC70_004162 [Mucor velutinosus]
MKIQTIIIGEYQISPAVSFCLYQLPSPLVTPPRSLNTRDPQDQYFNYFCLEDLFAIFDLHLINQNLIRSYQHYPGFFCKDEAGRSYIQTHVMADIAQKHNMCALADLCRLRDDELMAGGAIPLLKMTTFVRLFGKPAVMSLDFEARPLEGIEWFFQQNKVKLEPFSPTLPAFISPSNSPHPRTHRLSSDVLSNASSSLSITSQMAASPAHKEDNTGIKLPKPSSLLLKRLAPKHGHKKNLTILTPSYNDDDEDSVHLNSIQSAPLKRSTIPPFHHLHSSNSSSQKHKITKRMSPPTASFLTVKSNNLRRLAVPATASAVSAPWPKTAAQTRFPSPPIVPSQQPAWGQYRQQQHNKLKPTIKTATVPYFPRTPTTTTTHPPATAPTTSSPSASSLPQKQKFLQPFEFLYDHIEQTRTLKTTLDDQIRRSSSLMQTLQSSGTMVESLVRRQVRDMVDQKFESKLKECIERISRLEHRVPAKDIPISPSVSPSPTRSKMASVTATTNEPVQDLLSQLMNRIDQLESKLERQA